MDESLTKILVGMSKNNWETFKQEVDRKFNEKSSQNTLRREDVEKI